MKINLDILTWHKVHRMTAGASYTGCSPWMHQKCAATPTYQLSHLTHLHSCIKGNILNNIATNRNMLIQYELNHGISCSKATFHVT